MEKQKDLEEQQIDISINELNPENCEEMMSSIPWSKSE
jgi:hypothetical protein